MQPPAGDTWVELTPERLPLGAIADWAVRPDCGALALFAGTARDHADGRPEVTRLEYEAYEEQVVPRLTAIADETRTRWPVVGRIAMVHRVGVVPIGQASVIVAVSSPHRGEAFAAARYGIEALKAGVPIWKRETWSGGDDWSSQHHELIDVDRVEGPR